MVNKVEQQAADNEVYKRMWRIQEDIEASEYPCLEDMLFYNANMDKIVEYYNACSYKWSRVKRSYDKR